MASRYTRMQRAALAAIRDGETHVQIAERFGVTRSAISQRVHRAKLKAEAAGARIRTRKRKLRMARRVRLSDGW